MPYLLFLPALLVLGFMVLYPICSAFYLSFHRVVLFKPGTPFVGFTNYLKVLNDEIFWLSFKKSFLVWTPGIVGLEFILGLLTAFLLNQNFKGRNIVRSLILIPWISPSVLTSLMWMWMYSGNYGLINDILFKLGLIPEFHPWLADPSTVLISIMVAVVWCGIPFFAIMLLAGLQAIPKELYEVSKVDGANSWQQFISITVPMLMPTIVISVLLGTIWVSNSVDFIYVMTEGGPGYNSLTLPIYTFKRAYKYFDFGYASTLAMFLVLILMVFLILYLRALKATEIKL